MQLITNQIWFWQAIRTETIMSEPDPTHELKFLDHYLHVINIEKAKSMCNLTL